MGTLFQSLYESSACSIIFYNVFSDNVNNLYESILLITSFLFFFVGKVLVANEKSRRNNLYLTDDVNIFVKNVPATTEKNSRMWFSLLLSLRIASFDKRIRFGLAGLASKEFYLARASGVGTT